MPRTYLRSHFVGGSVAFAVLLIGSGAAWAQAGAAGSATGAAAATASGESVDTGSTSASSGTGSFDATLSTNPLGLPAQSTGPQRSNNRRQADFVEDTTVDGFLRDSGLRSTPSFGASSNANAPDFSARPSRSLGVQANPGISTAQGSVSGNGAAFGVNAIASDSLVQGGSSGNGNGLALGHANVSFFSAHVRSKGNTEAEDHAKGNRKTHGRNADSDDLLADAGDRGKGKKLGNARFDESSIVQVASGNPVISGAVALPSDAAAVVPAALPAVAVIPGAAAATVGDLSAPGLQAAPSPVPEPANWLLLALGLAVLGGRALMRRGTLVR